MQGVILFDIDGTLFDTPRWKTSFIEELSNILGISFEECYVLYLEHMSTYALSIDFNPERFCAFLAIKSPVPIKKLLDVFYGKVTRYKECLYQDTMPVLEALFAKGYILGIFSEGNKRFQLQKLKATGIFKYLTKEYIYIFRRKVSETAIRKLVSGAVIIDDKWEKIKRITFLRKDIRPLVICNQSQPLSDESNCIERPFCVEVIENHLGGKI